MIRSTLSRRTMLSVMGASGAALALPAWARGGDLAAGTIQSGSGEVRGPVIDLTVGAGHRLVQGRRGHAVAVNGTVPGPLVRLKQGENVRINVHNGLNEDTSIHWHGILLPFQFDGVPGVSFPGIAPGKTFSYEFLARQSGTYWWHSHSGLQEQAGHYGPLIVDPAGPDPVQADRDYVLLLSEFTPMHPHLLMRKLKAGDGYFNYQQTNWTDDYPLSAADRRMWGKMRMMPTDIADVTGSTYTYLANGRGPGEGLEYLFGKGERIRLRIINGSAMTFFNVRIPGLPMTVVAADGQNVRPVQVDEFQIGVAESYDVVIEPGAQDAYTIVAESMDRSGMAVATLASAPGLRADVPALRDPVVLTMADMGMNHGAMQDGKMDHGAMDHGAMDHGAMNHAAMNHGAMNHGGMDHGAMDQGAPAKGQGKPRSAGMGGMPMRNTSLLPPTVEVGPGIDMVSMAPVDKMDDPGLGLRGVEHATLDYRKLIALEPNTDLRPPSRTLEIHLTGNMERYMWSFDGRKYSAVSDSPIRFAHAERVRVKLVNDTMMAHPIHLHGMFFTLVNGQEPADQPRKHTVVVQPGASAQFDLTAEEPGDWAFHCHLLYHMHAGMFQVVTVAGPKA